MDENPIIDGTDGDWVDPCPDVQVARCVLASMMMSGRGRLVGLKMLSPSDFKVPLYRRLFDLMPYSFWDTQAEGVTKMLDAALGHPQAARMRNEIMFIKDFVPTDANIEYYCEALKE